MKDIDDDELLGRHFSGDPPREALKEQTLRDSTAAFIRVRRRRSVWRGAELAAAAVLIASVAFLGGRLSVPRVPGGSVDVTPRAAAEREGLTVPSELVAWLEAARFFRQLGMEDRMARAVDRAGRLLPVDTVASATPTELSSAVCDGVIENQSRETGFFGMREWRTSCESVNGVMAQSLGGYNHASGMD